MTVITMTALFVNNGLYFFEESRKLAFRSSSKQIETYHLTEFYRFLIRVNSWLIRGNYCEHSWVFDKSRVQEKTYL